MRCMMRMLAVGALALASGCAFFEVGSVTAEPSYETPRTFNVTAEDMTLAKALKLAAARTRWGVDERKDGKLFLTRRHGGFYVTVEAILRENTCAFRFVQSAGIRAGDARYRRYLGELEAALRRVCGETK